MLVVFNNQKAFNYEIGQPVLKMPPKGDVIVAIDPSKTNCACYIGNPLGDTYCIIEFSGNNRGSGPAMDTTVYCNELVHYLREFLSTCNVYDIGVEKAIMKKGMEHYQSSMTLTEIRARLLELASEWGFTKSQTEVNNFAWKSDILPDGYRGHSEKGSKRFFRDYYPDSPLNGYFAADATDAACIFMFICKRHKDKYKIHCQRSESTNKKFSVAIYPMYMKSDKFREFIYNTNFSLQENCNFYVNRSDTVGVATVPTKSLTLDDVYAYSTGFSPDNTDETVRLVVSVQ